MLNPKKNAWLQKVEAKWEKFQASVKEKFAENRIEKDLEEKMVKFNEKVEGAKKGTEEQIEELKKDLELAWNDLETAVGRFKSREFID